MPYIHIQTNHPLSKTQQQQLQQETTQLMNALMGKRQEVTVVQVSDQASEHWSINGTALNPTQPPAAIVDIKITAGTNTNAEKTALLAATTDMLNSTLGITQEACYTIIDEIPAANWGYNGLSQAQRAAQVQSVAQSQSTAQEKGA